MIGGKSGDLGGLPVINIAVLAVLALAGYRSTQLIVWDSILDPIRDRIHLWQAHRPESRPRELITTLIGCPYCMGFWLSGIILAIYLTCTGTWGDAHWLLHGVEWFAIAGGAVLLNRWDDTRAAV